MKNYVTKNYVMKEKVTEKITKKVILLIILSSFQGQVSAVNAGAFEEGIKFFAQKEYAQAEKLWQPLAQSGDARAQFNLALALQKKKPDSLHKEKALEYLAMSRAEGLVDAYLITSNWLTPNPNVEIELATIATIETITNEPPETVSNASSWLNQQRKKNYTLQLATGKNLQTMEKTKKKLASGKFLVQPDNLYIHKLEKKVGKKMSVRYVLLYGVFDNLKLANEQVNKLPQSLQKSKPWIRQFKAFQSIVKAEQP